MFGKGCLLASPLRNVRPPIPGDGIVATPKDQGNADTIGQRPECPLRFRARRDDRIAKRSGDGVLRADRAEMDRSVSPRAHVVDMLGR